MVVKHCVSIRSEVPVGDHAHCVSLATFLVLEAAAGQEEPPGLTSWQQLFGTPLSSVASVVAVLNDFEDMVISLVPPLVQVYTIPKRGELAYVGHVCNFRQEASSFLSSLPVRPADMPFILVRPRAPSGAADRKPRMPFRVDVVKFRAAYDWLKNTIRGTTQ